jgi:hypothetical protein
VYEYTLQREKVLLLCCSTSETHKDMIMRTMTIEYDGRNRAVTCILEGLISSGLIRRSKPVPRRRRQVIEFENALREAQTMAADITVNGTGKYKTLDELLREG